MAGKNEYRPKHSPFKILIYIIMVVVLLMGIGYLIRYTNQKKATFAEQIKALNEDEIAVMQTEESEKLTESTEPAISSEQPQDAESETETEIKENVFQKHILVLNGSGKDGMAAQWKKKLQEMGYENISIASYPGEVVDQTVIYSKNKDKAVDLEKLFSNPKVIEEAFTAEINEEETEDDLGDVEIYIVIGTSDSEA